MKAARKVVSTAAMWALMMAFVFSMIINERERFYALCTTNDTQDEEKPRSCIDVNVDIVIRPTPMIVIG